MTEKDLVSQLNNLKNIKPDNAWKRQSRDILLSQISGGYFEAPIKRKETIKEKFFSIINNFFAKPAVVAVSIIIVIFGGSALSLNASRGSKPGDSLYIAKIISEKTQQAITFNEEKKAKLGITFAGNRANEIARVLMSESDEKKKTETVEKLTEDLKKEIISIRTRIKKINKDNNDNNGSDNKDEGEIFSANLGKDSKGIQVYDPNSEKNNENQEANDKEIIAAKIIITEPSNLQATSSDRSSEKNDAGKIETGNIEKVLSEAGQMLDNKDYSNTLNKLEEADRIVSQTENSGENKKEENPAETATSTR